MENELLKELKGKGMDINTKDILLDVIKAVASAVASKSGEKLVDYIELLWGNRKEFISKCKNLLKR
ncbi:MAG: hypothetical protein LBC85_03545 [Fibromonadaceae bacterium]|nr:hypothetical protein [Fibromonadaceae bacterium]